MEEHNEERVTLTQRRVSSGASKLDRNRLSYNDDPTTPASAGKVVVWVIIIVVVAIAAYLGLKNVIQNSQGNTTPTPTVTVTPSVTDSGVVKSGVLDDSVATPKTDSSLYKTTSTSLGASTVKDVKITNLEVQQYSTFIRFTFDLDLGTSTEFPLTTAAFDSTGKLLKISFNKIKQDTSGLDYDKSADIDSNTATSVKHLAVSGDNEEYDVTLVQSTTFSLIKSTTSGNQVIVDVKEVATTPSPTVNPSLSVTPSSIDAGSDLQNDFSKGSQSITTSLTANTVRINKYNFGDGSTAFTYNLFLTLNSGEYPNVEAELSGTKLTLTVKNISYDAIVGNGGSGSTDFAAKGVRDVNKVTIKNSSNVSTYVFDLDKEMEYRTLIDQDAKVLRIEFKH